MPAPIATMLATRCSLRIEYTNGQHIIHQARTSFARNTVEERLLRLAEKLHEEHIEHTTADGVLHVTYGEAASGSYTLTAKFEPVHTQPVHSQPVGSQPVHATAAARQQPSTPKQTKRAQTQSAHTAQPALPQAKRSKTSGVEQHSSILQEQQLDDQIEEITYQLMLCDTQLTQPGYLTEMINEYQVKEDNSIAQHQRAHQVFIQTPPRSPAHAEN